jgi:hypothetical protein
MEATRTRTIPWSPIAMWSSAVVIAFGVGALFVLWLLREPMGMGHVLLADVVIAAVIVLVLVRISRRQRDEWLEYRDVLDSNKVMLGSLHFRVNDILAVQQWLATNIAAAAKRVEHRADELQNGVDENNIRLEDVTGELPKVASETAADVMAYVKGLIEAGERDRDLQIAALHDELAKAKDEQKAELQACMRWVLEQLGEAPR